MKPVDLIKSHPVITALVAALLCFTAWYAISPTWTVSQMKSAAEAHDSDKLSAYIDYPQLRENLKQDINQKMSGQAGSEPGNILINTLMNAMIDTLVTPQTIEKMFNTTNAGARENKASNDKAQDVSIDRHGLNRFDLIIDGEKPGEKLVIEFQRSGLSWKMVALNLPEDPAMFEGPFV